MFQQTQFLESTDPLFLHIQQLTDINGYVVYDNAHYFYEKKPNGIIVRDVSQHIMKQHDLFRLLLFGVLCLG